MHHLELQGDATPPVVFLKTAKVEGNYGILHCAKLYTVIYQIGRSFGAKKGNKTANILLF